jgi:hypothetical protein
MVKAKQEGDIKCPQGTEEDFDLASLNRIPTLCDNQNPLYNAYYIGKQSLKDNYFGQTAYQI